MNVELSVEELSAAVRLFVLAKTGVDVRGRKVSFQLDSVTERVCGASVDIDAGDTLASLGGPSA